VGRIQIVEVGLTVEKWVTHGKLSVVMWRAVTQFWKVFTFLQRH